MWNLLNESSKRLLAVALATTIGICAVGSVHAHKGATGIVKTRMDTMKAIGERMKALSLMANGRRPYAAAAAKLAAAEIAEHARHITKQFPNGSVKPPSEALPAIWQDWPRFEKLANDLVASANAFAAAAPKTASEAKPLVAEIGGTCSGCHKSFKQKKD